ncbi:hypothetical protein ASPZODRAFT_20388 [Penicilliopsis zonata CBS 506.65]|uniref:Carboxylesterase type B domain-containing protein n=1 Tax=Penicilliopsis zonata CBS 506.65 TaxID=1073090 RepID=A0A1L9S620_9EURO|nr:hypothetical protein ASPZODRAFT_20388 [Penicilliopsis zonata CBS 506.65]OJJ42619.1 hypothetical protein ASPZODRAFT_20388 [Penicilliopsis zonata CBS 506.65]
MSLNYQTLILCEALECMRQLPMETLLEAAYAFELTIESFGGFDVFIPTSPSSFIPDSPSTLLKTGRFVRNIDILSGWTENDGSLWTSTDLAYDLDVADFFAASYPGLTNATIQKAMALHPLSQFANNTTLDPAISAQYFRASQMQRDLMMTCVSLLTVQTNTEYGGDKVSNYLYALNQTVFATFFDLEGVPYYGVPHFSEIPYVFDNLAEGEFAAVATASDYELASAMSAS